MHLHLLQPLEDLQLHLISSLQALAASDRVIQTIFNELRSLDHPQPSGDGIFCIDGVLDAGRGGS